MIHNKFIKTIFCLLLITVFSGQVKGQSIEIELKIHSVNSTAGMTDVEKILGFSFPSEPDLSYTINPIRVEQYDYSNSGYEYQGESDTMNRIYYDQPSENVHIVDKVLYSNIIGDEPGELYSFNLQDPWAIRFDLGQRIIAWEEDLPYSLPIDAGDDYGFGSYYEAPLAYLARTERTPTFRTLSIEGLANNNVPIPFPYHFTFSTNYKLDALEPNLRYTNSAGEDQSTFCKGEKIYIRADYKGLFYNGLFKWQRNDGDVNVESDWYNVSVFNRPSNVLIVTADQSMENAKFRTRLVTTRSFDSTPIYGVTSFQSPTCVATIFTPPTIYHSVTSFDVIKKNQCEIGSGGAIQLNNIIGARAGNSYLAELTLLDSMSNEYEQVDTLTFTCSTAACPEFDDKVFSQLGSGVYKVGIFSNIDSGQLPCGRKKGVSIDISPEPVFSIDTSIAVCFGGNGQIHFNNIINLPGSSINILTAIDTSGLIFTDTIFERNGTLNVPVGRYTVMVENRDQCIYEFPNTIDINEKPELTISVADLPTYVANGITYNGTCAGARYAANITIQGGSPPYRVFMDAPPEPLPRPPYSITDEYFNLAPDQNTLSVGYLSEGNYSFSVEDRFGCIAGPIPFTINNPDELVIPDLNITIPTVICNVLNNNGSVTTNENITGGVPPYTIYINGNEVSSLDTLGLGNTKLAYSVVDNNGCSVGALADVQNYSLMRMDDQGGITTNVIPCDGALNFTMHVGGGFLNEYDPNASYVFLLNGKNCDTIPDCNLDYINIGDIYFGLPPEAEYGISISEVGIHHFEVIDDNGCSITATYEFVQPNTPSVSAMSIIPPACTGGIYEATFYIKDINVDSAGGVGLYQDFTYELDGVTTAGLLDTLGGIPVEPPQFTIPVSGVGMHSITVSDALGCSNPVPYIFSLEPVNSFDFTLMSVEDSQCSNDSTGSIMFSLNGDAPYNIEVFKNAVRIDSFTITNDIYRINQLADGDYTIQAMDSKSCTLVSGSIMVSKPNPIQAIANTTNTINCTGENGIIEVSNVSGGTAPYSYSFNGSPYQTDSIFSRGFLENVVTIKDTNNCVLELNMSISLAGPTIFPTLVQYLPAADCDDGSMIIEVQPGFIYPLKITEIEDPNNIPSLEISTLGDSIVNNIFTDTIYNLVEGKHYFLITDGIGCEKIDSVIILPATPLSASIVNNTEESCYQQSSDGSITISVSGGTAPYSVLYNGANAIATSNLATFSNLPYGDYIFKIMDSRGCFFSLRDTIQAGSLPLAISTVSDYLGCVNDNLTATVTLSSYHGVTGHTYEWEDGNTSNPRSGLTPGEYIITVTDLNGCTTQDVAIITGLDSIIFSIKSITNVICQADSTGQIELTASGGFPPYQFSIDGGNNYQTDSLFTGLGIGTYEFLVKDSHDCLDTTSATITFSNPLNGTVATTNETCTAADDGTLTITVSGGIAPFSYSANNIDFQPQNEFTGLAAGTYTVWVQDGSGCKAVFYNNTITEPAVLNLTTSLVADEACNQMNGSALGSTTGGTLPYTFEWDGNVSLNDSLLENAAAGVHILKVTDANMCIQTSMVTIGFVAAPTLSVENSQDEICGMANGSIDLKIENGIAPFTFEWSHDASLNDSLATGLVAGNYDVTITDANACTDILNVTIGEIAGPTLSLENSQNEFCGMSNGLIDLSIENGASPFTFDWNHDASLNDSLATGLVAGNYSVTVTDTNGCTNVLSTTIIEIAGPTLSVFSKTNSTCTDDNGEIVLAITNGTSPFTYTWSHDNMLNNNTATNLSAGTYSATVTDVNGCQDVISTSINFEAAPTLSLVSFTNTDCLTPAGDITVQVAGGLSPFTFSWSHDANLNNATATGLTAGNYTVTVTDANGCSANLSQALGSIPPPSLSLENSQAEICGNANGSIDLKITNGVGPFTFAWSHDGMLNDSLAINLTAGNYTVTVTDAIMCTDILNISIDEIAAPSLSLENTQAEFCGMSNGQIDLKIENGVAPFTFSWSHDISLNDSLASGLAAGTYMVTVSDANACTDIFSTTINEIAGPTLSIFSKTNSICSDDNGAIVLQIVNGISPYTYTWSHNNMLNNNTATNLSAGNYSVTVTDGNGCTDSLTASIDFVNGPTASLENSQPEICGNVNGLIDLKITNGTAPYSFQWLPNGITGDSLITNLAAGTYFVTVTDANGCTNDLTTTVGFVNGPTVSLENSQPEICGNTNGSIDLKIVDGLPPYSFQWSPNGITGDSLIANLAAGTYTVTVSDANACTDIFSTTINEIAAPSLVLENSQPEICGNTNGLIDLKIENGIAPYSFQWSHDLSLNDSLATGLAAGFYSVTISDANACTDILSTTINEIAGPNLSVFSKTNSLCTDNNGAIVLENANGTAPFIYTWSHDANLNNNTITNLPSGAYSATITDANGCQDVISTSIDFDEPAILISSNVTDAVCLEANGMIQLSVSGGGMQPYFYNWSHDASLNSSEATGLMGGNFEVTVSDALGCSAILNNIAVANTSVPTLSIASFNNTDCLNPMGDITVQVAGGISPFTFEWSHDSNVIGETATGLNSGNYSITATDANGCKSIVTQVLIEFEGNISITNPLECSYDSDGSLLVNLQGNPNDYDYTWSEATIPNSHIATNLSSGIYTVTVTNSNGCTQDFSIDLSAPDAILPNISNVIPVGCAGNLGSATVTPTGGTGSYNYTWNDPNGQYTPSAINLPVGNYSVLVSDNNGCTAIENIEIIQSTDIVLTQGQITNPLCNAGDNGSAEVVATEGFPPYNYLWSDGQTTSVAINLVGGDYTVTITDAVGCTQLMMTTIDDPIALTADGVLIQEPFCFEGNEGAITVSVVGGSTPYQYQWDDTFAQSTDTASALIAGNYNVTVTDFYGCSTIADIEIAQPAALQITSSIFQLPSCVGSEDGNIQVFIGGGTPDYQYTLNGGVAIDNNMFTNIGDGIYTVEIIDNNGCSISDVFEIEDPDSILLVSETLTPVSCEGTPNGGIQILAEGGNQNISYAWSNGMNNNSLENLATGNYEVSITDGLGCELIESFELESIDIAPLDLGDSDTLICNNGVLYYDFSDTDYIEFSWGNVTEGALSDAAEFSTYGENIYYLHALRNDGCVVKDSIDVRYTGANLDAFFIAPTDIVVGDTIIALELTLPVPDDVEWEFDDTNIELVEQRENQYLFYFSAVGEYDLKMTSTMSGCQSDISKTIFVYADSTQIPFFNATVPTIAKLKLFPNPSDGIFTVDVELANVNDMVIDIFNDQSMLVDRQLFSGKDIYSKNYELNLPTGIYYLIVQVAGARRSLTFVID